MDSTLGPVLANISLCHFEEKWILNNFTTLALPFGFYTYTLTTPSPCLTVKTHHHSFCTTSITVTQISNSPLNLKRTQSEENSRIPFLDIVIKRHSLTFSPSICRKKIFTGLYTKRDNFTPGKCKVNLIRTLTFRCIRIGSSPSLLR